MTTVIESGKKPQKEEVVGFGVYFPKSLVERIDAAKTPYIIRMKFIQRTMTEYLDGIERRRRGE
jgi:hypothetical protein